ncbi:hypothetical protein CLOM621_07837 [Clostridium sp. M62/1]|nr:hypothetical protein CLOM621_07837 [Clostridium sp. M62/1]
MVILYIIPFFIHKPQEKTDFEQSRKLPPCQIFTPVSRLTASSNRLFCTQHSMSNQ